MQHEIIVQSIASARKRKNEEDRGQHRANNMLLYKCGLCVYKEITHRKPGLRTKIRVNYRL